VLVLTFSISHDVSVSIKINFCVIGVKSQADAFLVRQTFIDWNRELASNAFQVAMHVVNEAPVRLDVQLCCLIFRVQQETGRSITSSQNATVCKVTHQGRITGQPALGCLYMFFTNPI
jgi:hypothetical protein